MGVAAPLILLAGASGQVGSFALPRLVGAGCEVIAVNRSGKAPSFMPRWPGVQWCTGAGVRERVGARSVRLLSTGPVALAATLLAQDLDADRALVFSTTSVTVKADSADPAERATIQEILRDEVRVAREAATRGIPLTVLRPTLVWGAGMDDNLARAARWVRRFGVLPLAAPARGLRQPVHADDLARTAVQAILVGRAQALDTPVVGADTLAYRDMMAAVFRALGRTPRMPGLPEGVMVTLVRVSRAFGGLRGVNPEMIRRQNRDLVFDDRLARERLGHSPRPFAPTAEDFDLPTRARLDALVGRGAGGDQASLR